MVGCHSVDEYDNDQQGNFEQLWSIIDTHYCFFEEKGINWDSIHDIYARRIDKETNVLELFDICSDMLNELRDGHVNLISPFATSYYKKWWADYPQNFDQRLLDEYYLHFGGYTRGGFTYAVLDDSIAYVRYPSFSTTVSETTLDWMLMLLRECPVMVFDIRDNGGGAISNVETLVSRFITSEICGGYISHKSGPGHGDFSKPYAFTYKPAETGRMMWLKPIVLLTNRSTFSAANNFTSVMKHLPGVIIVGDRTGGGSGMPFSSEIQCGWAVRFSASPVYDAEMQLTEFGVEPDVYVDLNPEAALEGHDTMLDKALAIAHQVADSQSSMSESRGR